MTIKNMAYWKAKFNASEGTSPLTQQKHYTASDTTRVQEYRDLADRWGGDPANLLQKKYDFSNPDILKKFEGIVEDKRLSQEMGSIPKHTDVKIEKTKDKEVLKNI